jgi:hypothetical protein
LVVLEIAVDRGDELGHALGGPAANARMPKRKTESYVPVIEQGIPIPPRTIAAYKKKIPDGVLIELAERIRPTESVQLPVGSMGKFRTLLKARGLQAVSQSGQGETVGRIWVLPRRRMKTARPSNSRPLRGAGSKPLRAAAVTSGGGEPRRKRQGLKIAEFKDPGG